MTAYLSLAVALLCAVAVTLSAGVQAATVTALSLSRPEGSRQYLLAQPVGTASPKRPLVILLQGHGGSAAQVLGQGYSASPLAVWLQLADREGVLVAAPDGERGQDRQRGWNDCRGDAPDNPQTDDVGLVRALIDREVAEHNADPARVFVMGMSNGGMMAFRLAIELGDRLAGFAAVSASMASQSACPLPQLPLSALIVSGTADPLVPYAGGNVHFLSAHSRGAVIGVERAATVWRELDALPATPFNTTLLPHRDPADATRVTRTLWGADPRGPQVELLRIDGGGHVEPSIDQRFRQLYTRLVGAQNGDVEAAEEAWAFFRDKHAALPR